MILGVGNTTLLVLDAIIYNY